VWGLGLLAVLLLSAVAVPQAAMGQSTQYTEDFEAYSDGATNPNNKWSRDISDADLNSGDHFEVKDRNGDKVFEGRNLDGDAIWETKSIDISSFSSVSFSLNLTEEGDLEDGCGSCDYADVAYSTDGGTNFTTITNWNGNGNGSHTLVGNWTDATVTQSGLSGDTFVLRVTMNNNAGTEDIRLDDVTVVEGPTVQFTSSSATVNEGDGSTTLTVEISNPSGDASVDVALDGANSSADASDLDGYSTQTVNFNSPSDGDTETVNVTVTDDSDPEGAEVASFVLESASSAVTFTPDQFDLTLTDNDASSLLISEIMPNPDDVGDSDGEYVEIYNTTDSDIDLNGYIIKDLGSDSHTINSNVTVPAGRYVVLCKNETRSSNGYVPCDYEWSSFTLTNSSDEVIIEDGNGSEVDRVEYASGWPFGSGQSMVFTGAATDGNNIQSNWTGASDRAGYDRRGDNGSDPGADTGTPGGRGAHGSLPVVTEIDGSAGAEWRMLSAPVSSATVGDLTSQNLVQGVANSFPGAEPNIYTSFEGTGTSADNWTAPSGTSSSLTPGQRAHGFLWYFFDNSQSESVPLPFLLEYTGGVNTSDVSVTLPNDETWHLLGNPFSFPIDISGLTATESFQGTVQVYDPDNNNYQGVTQTSESNESNETDDVIAPHQGFFVELSSTGSGNVTFTFESDDRIDPGASVNFYKAKGSQKNRSAEASPGGSSIYRLPIHLTGRTENGTVVTTDRGSKIVVRDDAVRQSDRWDATKLQPLSTPFASIGIVGPSGNEEEGLHLIRSLPSTMSDTTQIPLRIVTQGTDSGENPVSSYKLHWPGLDLPDEWTAELVDTQNGETIDLRAREDYIFDAESPSSTSGKRHSGLETTPQPNAPVPLQPKTEPDSARFFIRFETTPIPVELTDFAATLADRAAQLTWTTAGETNNAGFHVEHREPDAEGFASTGFVEGHGTTDQPQQYRFRTDPLDPGRHVFRLKQVDLDGSATRSDTVAVQVRLAEAAEVNVAPNPVRNRATVTLRARTEQEITVALYDVLGRRVRTLYDASLTPGRAQTLRLDPSGLSSGLYLLRADGEQFQIIRRVTIVQ
jgi:hypothetical protein